jgi:hypothetical protein
MAGSMATTRATRIGFFTLGAIALTGCTLGRGYSPSGWSVGYAQAGPDVRAAGQPRSVAIAVLDQRPYVLEGAKAEIVVASPGDGPEPAKRALARTFAAHQLLFTILEWRTDTNWTTRLDFDLSLEVLAGGADRPAVARVSGKETSDSSIRGAERDAQAWFAAKVAGLLSDDAVAASFR